MGQLRVRHERLSPGFIARSRVRGRSEQDREEEIPEWPHRHVSPGPDKGLLKRLRIRHRMLRSIHYLQPLSTGATILGISLAMLSFPGRSLRQMSSVIL